MDIANKLLGFVIVGAFSAVFWLVIPAGILWLVQKHLPKHEWMFRAPISKVIWSPVARRLEARREAKLIAESGLRRLGRDRLGR